MIIDIFKIPREKRNKLQRRYERFCDYILLKNIGKPNNPAVGRKWFKEHRQEQIDIRNWNEESEEDEMDKIIGRPYNEDE